MKKYIIICLTIIVLGLGADYLYYYNGALFFPYTGQSTCFTGADNESLYLDTGDGLKVHGWMRGYLTWVLPLIVLFIFLFGLYDKFWM